MKTKIHNGWEYTIEDEQKGKEFSEIVIPKGWELWNPSDCFILCEDEKLRKEFNLKNCWFFIKNPLNKNYVAWFNADSYGAYLGCYGYPSDSYSSLGVRFKRKVEK